jgi:hypothetical protein
MSKHKGDLDVSREVNSKRSNEALSTITITANRLIDRYDQAWMAVDASATNRVIELPDASGLPVGWKVVIHNISATADLEVRSFDGSFTGTVLKTIEAPIGLNDTLAYQFVLRSNGTAAGVWYVIELGDASRLRAARFVVNFLTADWPAAVSGRRELTSTQAAGLGAATHDRGTTPEFTVWEKSGTDYDKVTLDRERTNSSGDILLRIINGDEFDGRVIII